MNKTPKDILKYIKIYVYGSLSVFVLGMLFWGYLVASKAFQGQKLIDAQVEYQKALTEQVGKPQMIIQEYRSPMKGGE